MHALAISLIVVLLTNLLPAQQTRPGPPIEREIAALSSASLVEVRMKNGDKLRGRIASHEDTDFSFAAEKGGAQTITYDQVLSVSQVRPSHSKRKWIIIGVVAVAAIGIVAGIFLHSCGSYCH